MIRNSDGPTSVYGDGRVMALPDDWRPVEPSMLDTALAMTQRAFTGEQGSVEHAVDRLLRYYDPNGGYAGATFLGVPVADDYAVTAADLWAVTTLEMKVPPDAGRRLLHPGPLRSIVEARLRDLPPESALSATTPTLLEHMSDLYNAIRTMLPRLGNRPTNQWVLSAKTCARKRPELFPVRDSKVCTYLSDNRTMGGRPGQLGWFTRDIQVLAYLITHPLVQAGLGEARAALREAQPTWSIDQSDLRLLDVVLWSEATGV
ncbi:hypothetical protein SAMN05660642_04057 [Geodermatophilus siccatus]|uniref:Uncharacterized protein n=1 Tax=Geodermatophilus siccatus TaxID=1137991 RepID=A0A1G9YQ76_9ACTN|nr:DUF6308 family protein [Geodermatophilus siccatus]SDN10745.1 hypothetical protein SAMN05660642_04057 [Geodermatophilus siccatus]